MHRLTSRRVMKIDSVFSLRQVFFHDARLMWGGWYYDEDARRFRLEAWLGDTSLSIYRPAFWLFQKKTTPLRKHVLILDNVTECVEKTSGELSGENWFELSTIEYDSETSRLVINTHYVLTIKLRITDVSGSFTATDEISWHKPYRSYVCTCFRPPAAHF
jgi:hypothetical protein